MEQPIINPPNPYIGSLRIFPGTLVRVLGRPRPNATRFAINFQTGPSMNPRDNLALHLSPCFTPPRVVRNSLCNGAWGPEEAWGNGSIFNPHQPFEILILAEMDQFKIAINGAHYCEFKHRIPFQEITHLTIDGDVDIDRIIISSSYTYAYQPSAPPTSHALPYPPTSGMSMPMPPMYPTLQPGQSMQTGLYPNTSMPSGPMSTGASYGGNPSSGMPSGPMPTGASYMSGYPQNAGPYSQMPNQPGSYPQAHQMGPNPTGAGYQGGNPQQHQQPGHSSSPFGSLPIGGKALGTLAGLGLGAAVLSAANPLKHVKKMMKPKKMFKNKGWGSSSSSNSSISSRSSFSSNSS